MLTAQQLYDEYSNDPSSIYGAAGAESEYRDAINLIRASITVTRTSTQSGPSAGSVVDTLVRQLICDTFDEDELNDPANSSDVVAFDLLLKQDEFQFTEGLKAQILGLTGGGTWTNTRQALIELQTRQGSRSEELQGVQTTRADNDAVQAYWEANSLTPLWGV